MRKVNEKSEPFKVLPRSNKLFKIKYLGNILVQKLFCFNYLLNKDILVTTIRWKFGLIRSNCFIKLL